MMNAILLTMLVVLEVFGIWVVLTRAEVRHPPSMPRCAGCLREIEPTDRFSALPSGHMVCSSNCLVQVLAQYTEAERHLTTISGAVALSRGRRRL